MAGLKSRIAKGVAVAVAAAIPATVLGAAPAHAADHFTVDTDSVVVGTNGTNSYKAFDGSMESWHDGSRIRATLKGTYVGRGYLRVEWHYAGGTHSDMQDVVYSGGVQKDVPGFTSPSDKDVVRAEISYWPNSGDNDYVTRYVGDDPESSGSCGQLDEDSYDLSANGATFHGTTSYRCTSAGQVYAHIHGTISGPSGTDWGTASLDYSALYADGTNPLPKTLATVNAGGTTSMSFDAETPTAVDVRSVTLTLRHGVNSSQTKKFGDA